MPLTVADADRQLQLLAQAHLDLEQCAAPLLVPSANALPRAGAASSTSKSASLSASPALTSLHQLDTALRNVRQRAAVVERAYEEARAVVDRCMREIETEDASVAAHIVDLVRQVDAVEQQRRRWVVLWPAVRLSSGETPWTCVRLTR